MSGQLNGSVLTAFTILKLFTESRPIVTTQDVCDELEINATKAYRFLRTLEVAGALVTSKRGQYRLSALLSDLGERATASSAFAGLVQPYLNQLADKLNESALATILQNNRMVVIARARSARPYSMSIDVGMELEAHCTANGKLWLATMSTDELERYLSVSRREQFTTCSIVDAEEIRRTVRKIREDGYADCAGEREREISAVAVPVLSKSGKMMLGISVFGHSSRFSDGFQKHAIEALQDSAIGIHSAMYGANA